jgi:hypothetical protein
VNKYPEWWDQTTTVYNKFENPSTRVITWYKTVLKNCFWKHAENKLTVGETTLETAVTLCRVPVSGQFLEKYEWEKLTDAERSNYFTFGPGDILVRGAVEDQVNEYQQGQRSSDLMKKYKNLQGCMLIQQCSVNTGRGRGNEHYLVKGV